MIPEAKKAPEPSGREKSFNFNYLCGTLQKMPLNCFKPIIFQLIAANY